jgi:hypothetical protein
MFITVSGGRSDWSTEIRVNVLEWTSSAAGAVGGAGKGFCFGCSAGGTETHTSEVERGDMQVVCFV